VGKTYAMLAAARRAREDGRDVAIGLIETHGRKETLALVDGLEQIALRPVTIQNRTLTEFDLDAALKRAPQLLLVDELAHSNLPGSRHPKRWQDVDELLDAGIDVWTALNVQHLESLNDVVGGITGIRVSETVPDKAFDAADEVVLVDIPADELLARLKAGKVYMPAQAERAAGNFFRKGNLMALREIALRRTADRIEDDVQTYRVEKSIADVWKTEGALMACIGAGPGAEHVVRNAARLAGQLNVQWHAVYVETPALQGLAQAEREGILAVLKLAESLQGKSVVLAGNDVAALLAEHARQHNLSRIVFGRRVLAWHQHWPWQEPMARQLARLLPEADLIAISQPAVPGARPQLGFALRSEHEADAPDPKDAMRTAWRYGLTLAAVALTAALTTPLVGHIDLANIVMLFLLAVVLVAAKLGRGPGALAAFVSVAVFDFFYVPPRFTFAVSDFQYVMTFAVMLAVGLIVGQLTAGLRFAARISRHREDRAQRLSDLARELSAALQNEQVIELGTAAIKQSFGGDVLLILPDANDRLDPKTLATPGIDAGIAQWCFDKQQVAGFATDTLPAHEFRYVPLKATMRIRGVLAIRPADRRWLLIPEQQRHLEILANLIAIALERVHYVDVAQHALLQMESERLRNSLLATVSHDLRTPLTALVGLADSLQRGATPAQQGELVRAIHDEALRMNALVNNLLEMARLQSGQVKLNLEWQPIEEVVGSAIHGIRPALGTRSVLTDLPEDLPLVRIDAVLIERVLVNLLENALKYAPGDTPLELSVRREKNEMRICVSDRGPGLPKGNEESLFEKFVRGDAESATPGVGLGLAICRAIVEAHRGKISAGNRNGGGAQFCFDLPLGQPPELPAEPAALPMANSAIMLQ
jgi:two-component system sensor histidine kinase KdpD